MLRVCFLGLIAALLLTSCAAPIKLNNQYKANVTPGTATSLQGQKAPTSSAYAKSTHRDQVEQSNFQSEISNMNTEEVDLDALQLSIPSDVQIKYASLLNMTPTTLTNVKLLESVDEWYGTRYRYGGTTKTGIDCSAFVRAVYKSAFGINLPRTAREQFIACARVISSKLQQGDLLFFNTTGGISHVGMYLGNNKFVHASSGRGVTVSDLDERYYATRYLGARRMMEDSAYYATNSSM